MDKDFRAFSERLNNFVSRDYYIHDIKDFKSFNLEEADKTSYLQNIANNINKEYTVKKVFSCNSLKDLKSYTPEQLLRINEIFTKIYNNYEYLSVIDMNIPLHIATTKKFLNKCGKDVEKFEGEKILDILRRSLAKPRYWTHDNGGRSFEVEIDRKNVAVYKFRNYNEKDYKREDKPILTYYNCKNIFVGIDNSMMCNGNSILINTNNLNYVFIGQYVKSFVALAPIVSFLSPLQGSDVAYPTAIDENNSCYLIIENVIIFAFDKQNKYDDPYSYYYALQNTKSHLTKSLLVRDGEEDINYVTIKILIEILESDKKWYLKSLENNKEIELPNELAKDTLRNISDNKFQYLENKIIVPRIF